MTKKILLLGILLGFVSLTACRHTAEGVGKDVEKAGEKIQDKSK